MHLTAIDGISSNLATLTLAPQKKQHQAIETANDFALLQQKGLVDASGRLHGGHQSLFSSELSPPARTCLELFLNGERAIGDRHCTMNGIFITLFQTIGTPHLVKVLGDEIDCLLGREWFQGHLTRLLQQDPSTDLMQELALRLDRLPENLTVRFSLRADLPPYTRHALVINANNVLKAMFGVDSVKNCFFVDDGSHLSGFSIDFTVGTLRQKVSFIFATSLQNEFVATADAVQVVLTNSGHYLVDNGVGDQWAIDKAFKLLRIPHPGTRTSKVLFRYLHEHYKITGNELEIFKNEQLTAPNEQSLQRFCDQLNSNQPLFNAYLVACAASYCGYDKEAVAFVKKLPAVQDHTNSLYKLALELIAEGKVHASELDQIVHFFDPSHSLFATYDLTKCFGLVKLHLAPLQSHGLLHYFTQAASITEWIESLLFSPRMEQQHNGLELLYNLPGHIDLKKKWITHLAQTHSGQLLRFILQIESHITANDMERWLTAIPQRGYFFYSLFHATNTKWLHLMMKLDPDVTYRLKPSALTVKEHFQYIFHPIACKLAPEILEEALSQEPKLSTANKTHLRLHLKEMVCVLIESKKCALAFALVDLHLQQCGEVKESEVKSAILSSLKNSTSHNAQWYLDHLTFFGPRLEPAAQLELLLTYARQFPHLLKLELATHVSNLVLRLNSPNDLEHLQRLSLQVNNGLTPIFQALQPKKKPKPKNSESALSLLKGDPKNAKMRQQAIEFLQKENETCHHLAIVEHYKILDLEVWQRLLSRFSDNLEFDKLQKALLLLPLLPQEPTTADIGAIWYFVFCHPRWLAVKALIPVLNQIRFFHDLFEKHSSREFISKWQELARGVVKALVDSSEPALLSVAHIWFGELNCNEIQFQLGCDLLRRCCQQGVQQEAQQDVQDDFNQSCLLIEKIASYIEVLGLDEQLIFFDETAEPHPARKKRRATKEQMSQFLQLVATFFAKCKKRPDQPRVIDGLADVITTLVELAEPRCDAMLYKEAKSLPLYLQESILPVLGRRMIELCKSDRQQVDVIKAIKEVIRWVQTIVEIGTEEGLIYTYWTFFTDNDRLPSMLEPADMMKRIQDRANKEHRHGHLFLGLVQLLANHCERFLLTALNSSDNRHVKHALDIDFSISYMNSQEHQAQIRKKIANYPELYLKLFLRYFEEFGWTSQTRHLMQHHIHFNKSLLEKIPQEPLVRSFILKFVHIVPKRDPYFPTHKEIALQLLQKANITEGLDYLDKMSS